MTVYAPHNAGLGDQIATFNLLARRAEVTGQQQRLSCWQNGQSLERLHHELYDIFEFTNILAVNAPGNTPLSGFDVWAAEPWPTRTRWTRLNSHHYFVAQFDGISSAQDKNIPPEDAVAIGSELSARYGMQGFLLGKKQTIAECVELMANAAFFVGVDSGMSHLSHSVGTPTFILRDGPWQVVTTHRNKPYIGCHDAADFLRNKLPNWVSYRTFIGPGL